MLLLLSSLGLIWPLRKAFCCFCDVTCGFGGSWLLKKLKKLDRGPFEIIPLVSDDPPSV